MSSCGHRSLVFTRPLDILSFRWAAEERTICGKVIPRQCAVAAAVWVLHHDPRFWTNPWTFDPERFAPENRSVS